MSNFLFFDPKADYLTSAMTYDNFKNARAAFDQHYFSSQNQAFHSCVDVPFDQLQGIISAAVAAGLTNPGVTLIHRFDAQNNAWFVCMELCSLSENSVPDESGRETYTTTTQGIRYDINADGSINTSTLLSGYIDSVYFNNVYYTDALGGTPANIGSIDQSRTVFVHCVTFDWTEITALQSANPAPAGYNSILSLQSCTSSLPSHYGDAAVQWPHCIWLLMKNAPVGGGPVISTMAQNSPDTSFTGNAADVGTMCPPLCSEYIKPLKAIFVSYLKKRLTKAISEIAQEFDALQNNADINKQRAQ